MIDKIQYSYRANLENEQKLQAGYFRECINHYGIPVTYFRYQTDFFASPSGTSCNYTYGETPVSNYTVSGDFNIYMNIQEDNPFLKKFGMSTAVNSEIYFMRDEFEEEFRDKLGTPTTNIFTSYISGNVINNECILSGNIVNNDLSGYTSAYTSVPTGSITGDFGFTFIRYPKKYNDQIAYSPSFTERYVNGTLTGNLSGLVDISGNGIIAGYVSGALNYYNNIAVGNNPNFKIAPQPGDFIRLKEFDIDVDNNEEYEITEVMDKNLSPNGINPLLKRYIWKCSITRRMPSHENVIGTTQQEKFTPNLSVYNNWSEIVSNDRIFDYNNNIDNIDNKSNKNNVYGDW